MTGLESLLAGVRRCWRWWGVQLQLADIRFLRRDPMHADLPRLVILERELRP